MRKHWVAAQTYDGIVTACGRSGVKTGNGYRHTWATSDPMMVMTLNTAHVPENVTCGTCLRKMNLT